MKFAVAVIAAFALVLAMHHDGRADAPAGVQKWEYQAVPLTDVRAGNGDGLDMVNAAGKAGWELVAHRAGDVFYMKRPLK